jgi:minor extracellular serine protease Vpr
VPVQRTFGDRSTPRVRVGTIPLHLGGAAGRVRVIADLPLPPLAAASGRGLYSATGAHRRLQVHSAASQAYIARVAQAQDRAVAELRQAIPEARVGRRFRVLLDGLTITLPAKKLPVLVAQSYVTHVYPSIQYTLALDRSPSVIGADVLHQMTGADGTGIKIGIVDDGIDQTNPFFNPTGFSYPAGFPKGDSKYVTPKVIVARVFPGPNAGAPGKLPLDPASSFHGTHVAGIAAGDSGTTAPAGSDHPEVTGLSGVAPRAWLGNYRVFTVPTPVGHVANTPEIIAAFEAAVRDGMDVINFSGGGPQVEPANDALIEAIHNVAAAGVVPVIAAGNDRDDFGTGSTGSPGTAPDAISVAAVSNTHVFAPALDVTAPGAPDILEGIPFLGANGVTAPASWGSQNQTLIDAGSIVGTDGKPVERHLCGAGSDLSSTVGTLPAHSLDGKIVLAERGLCPFVTKADQAKAAGAMGIVLSDNRQGEANGIPVALPIPAGMIANLDGDHLRSAMAASGGQTSIRIGHDPLELETGRSGVMASFSSAGPTAFGHDLKPDVSAPGVQILSSTLPNTNASRFAVFDGTSMATPHVSGAAALLLQLHPAWTPPEVKSALVSTAGPAWADTGRTQEAPVTLEGGGLVALPNAADPRIFTDPVSLSFPDVNVLHGAASSALLVRIEDAGGGGGTWTVGLQSQAATAGASLNVAGTIDIAPGGEADLSVVASASGAAVQGENYGFIVLHQGSVTRRVPYFFLVDKPALAQAAVLPLKKLQTGTTLTGIDRVEAYRYPVAPFGNAPDQPPMVEDGAEKVYVTTLNAPAANAGVSVVGARPGVQIDPFYLGALDENTVQGFAGTPVDVNALTYDYLDPVQSAGSSFPRQQTFYVSVDSGRDRFSGKRLAGPYTLRSWVNDVTPPTVKLLSTQVTTGRPTIVVRSLDSQSGVDPLSLTIGYKGVLVGAASYDPITGIAVFPLPTTVPALKPGKMTLRLESSDFEEAKNVDTTGTAIMPNTRFASAHLRVVAGVAVNWLVPESGACVGNSQRLVVVAGSTRAVKLVRFSVDGRTVATATKGAAGIFQATWAGSGAAAHGNHLLTAIAIDRSGRTGTAQRVVAGCK